MFSIQVPSGPVARTLTLCNPSVGSNRLPLMRRKGLIGAVLVLLAISGCAERTPGASPAGTPSASVGTSSPVPTTESTSASRATSAPEPTSSSAFESTAEALPVTRPTLSCANQTGIDRSLDANFVGQPSPVEAAKWFVVQPLAQGYDVPPDAVWTVVGQSETGAIFVSTEGVLMEAFQSPVNQTWTIASATRCA